MSNYGAPRTDTPADLTSRGVSIVAHPSGGYCYHMRNSYGSGSLYGVCMGSVAGAQADARKRLAVQQPLIVMEDRT